MAQKIHLDIEPLAVLLLLLLTGCPGGGGGGITIVQNDSTGPTLTLGAGPTGVPGVTVSAGGSAQNVKLGSKTGPLNLLVMAKDPESGVRAVEIWVSKRTTTCDANGFCTTKPDSPQTPEFESTSPQKKPGDTTPDSSIMAQALDLSKEIPQGSGPQSLMVHLVIHAEAANHLGGRTKTPEITVAWSEPGVAEPPRVIGRKCKPDQMCCGDLLPSGKCDGQCADNLCP